MVVNSAIPNSPGSIRNRQALETDPYDELPLVIDVTTPSTQSSPPLPPPILPGDIMEKSQLSVYANFYENYPLGSSRNGSPSPSLRIRNPTNSPQLRLSPDPAVGDIPARSVGKSSASHFPLLTDSASDNNSNQVRCCHTSLHLKCFKYDVQG